MVIGGLAVAVLGRPRTTRDVDAIAFVEEERWRSFLKKAASFSFRSRTPAAVEFARSNRIFLLHHKKSQVDVDLSLAGLPFEGEALQRAQKVKVGRLVVPIPTPEDLIVLKAGAGRPRDWIDIDGILDQSAKLDVAYIRTHVDVLASDLEQPEIYQQLDERLQEHFRRYRRKK